jgi:glutamate N-acetyltransferase/amino-acid N-acetyltransferase
MPVNLSAPEKNDLLPVAGVKLGATSAGIKTEGKTDLVLIEIAEGSQVAAVYTQNAFCAAPVTLAKQHQKQTTPRYLLINSGNANAGTGEQGMQAAIDCCQAVAQAANVATETVLPFSTGVIGQQLPVAKMASAVPSAFTSLEEDNWFDAAHGIMTTDTIAKAMSKQVELDGKTITITGIAKGSGMIRPDMATMLGYVATDANIDADLLATMLKQASDQSFNRITVDGDTSTNDACVLIATGQANSATLTSLEDEASQVFYQAFVEVMQHLAHAIIRDGEGATKFIAINVQQAESIAECRQVAYTVAHSPLVKTALFASDPNWGRILAAVGRSGIADFDLSKVDIFLGDVALIRGGEPAAEYTEEQGQSVMDEEEISITIVLGRGDAEDTVWTCDFSYDYVKINAEYRT